MAMGNGEDAGMGIGIIYVARSIEQRFVDNNDDFDATMERSH
jgi:hypothetical protein